MLSSLLIMKSIINEESARCMTAGIIILGNRTAHFVLSTEARRAAWLSPELPYARWHHTSDSAAIDKPHRTRKCQASLHDNRTADELQWLLHLHRMLLHDASLAMQTKLLQDSSHATDVKPEEPSIASGIARPITICMCATFCCCHL